MKKVITSILVAFVTNLGIAQTDECRCNELFDKDLKSQFTSFSSQNSKEILYKYFSSDQSTRQAMKDDSSLEASVGLVIKAIPINIGFGSSSSSSSSKFYSMYRESIENKYISDEILQSLYSTAIPDKAFTSYEKCLDLCKNIYYSGGITLRNVSTQDDLIVLELKFKSTPSGGKISIRDATYSNGTVAGGKKFEKGIEILDGQVLYEHIKLNSEDNITVTIAFNEGVNPASLSLQAKSKIRKSSDAPLGTMIASLLNYNDFLKLNGLVYESDINKVIWVPCDGRDIGTAINTYGAYAGGKAPDLRGLFLRSVNDMGLYNATVPPPIISNLNPENKLSGQIQMDEIKSHSHKQTYTGGNHDRGRWTTSGVHGKLDEHVGNTDTSTTGGQETRPKNISVYYYIKIR